VRWLFLIAILGGCSSGNKHDDGPTVPTQSQPHDATAVAPTTPMPKVYLSTLQGDIAVNVEIAATPAKIERGLMFREHLPPENGMLFLMNEERSWPFWMRNTLIPLDMVFIRADGTIARIATAKPLDETPVPSGEPIAAVLEIAGGRAAELKVKEGDKVSWPH
jgi:uncharacterized membrane protein (UPF0127 family)